MAVAVVQTGASGFVLGGSPTNGNVVAAVFIGLAVPSSITDSNALALTDRGSSGAGDSGVNRLSDIFDYVVSGSPTATYTQTGGTINSADILEVSGASLPGTQYHNSGGTGLTSFSCKVGDLIVAVGNGGNPVLTGVSSTTNLGSFCSYGIANATSASASTVSHGGDICSVAVYTAAPTGTVASRQDDQHVSAAGAESISGTAAPRQDDQHVSGSGAETFAGAAASRQDDQHVSAVGAESIPGSGATRQDDQRVSASGLETIAGSAASAQDHQRVAVSGLVGMIGPVASAQDDQLVAVSGLVGMIGPAAPAQKRQTVNASGVETIAGAVAVKQAKQIVLAAGLERISGSASVAQARQLASIAIGRVATVQDRQRVAGTVKVIDPPSEQLFVRLPISTYVDVELPI